MTNNADICCMQLLRVYWTLVFIRLMNGMFTKIGQIFNIQFGIYVYATKRCLLELSVVHKG